MMVSKGHRAYPSREVTGPYYLAVFNGLYPSVLAHLLTVVKTNSTSQEKFQSHAMEEEASGYPTKSLNFIEHVNYQYSHAMS